MTEAPTPLGGILFVLHTGIPWRLLPQELGSGSGAVATPASDEERERRSSLLLLDEGRSPQAIARRAVRC